MSARKTIGGIIDILSENGFKTIVYDDSSVSINTLLNGDVVIQIINYINENERRFSIKADHDLLVIKIHKY